METAAPYGYEMCYLPFTTGTSSQFGCQEDPIMQIQQPFAALDINRPFYETKPQIQMFGLRNEMYDIRTDSGEPRRTRSNETTLMDRVAIRAALSAGLSVKEICRKSDLTPNQVYYARTRSVKPGKNRCGSKPAISESKAIEMVKWLHSDPAHQYIPYRLVSTYAPELKLHQFGEKAIRRAFESQGYARRPAKGLSKKLTRPRQMQLEYILNPCPAS
ncbi:hypothetical protein K3495_g7991 [Podosphaera aphanis]|nr:hypothetical protein K3495_g7991 [Podosphaera aphanis]